MSTDSVTHDHTATASSHGASPASAPTPQVGEGTRAHAADLRRRLIVSAPLGILAMLLSMVPAWQFTGWQWVVAAASIPVVTWGAWPFHRAAFAAGRHGSTTMDTLVSLGVISSTLWSWWALLWGGAGMLGMRMQMSLIPRAAHGGHAEIYFEGACMIVVFLLTGRYLEARARYRAGDALRSLLRMGAKEATLVTIDPATGERSEKVVPASSLQVGDLFAVRPGEKVATDGIIVEGSSALDTSLLTGESVPVDAAPGDAVTGATVNTWGSLLVRATRVGSDTTLAQIGRMVAEAQAGKAPVQRLADQISGVFVPIVILVSLLTLVGWLLAGGSVQAAFTAAVAVLVVACPCALGLATPTAILVGSGRASQLGILIKNAEILEQTRSIDTMLLDKTGTVTTGVMSLESVAVAPGAGGSPEADEASAPVGEVPDALSRRFGDQAEVSDDFQEDELESTTIRRRAFVAPQEESPVTEAAWKPREDAAERSVPQDTPESLDDVLFAGASIVPELPSRTGAHLFSFILGILALPITWYLVADAGARMTLPEGNPAATGVINWLAITELAIAFVAIIALFEAFKRSSLGAWIAGLCFLAAGIPWVFAPAFTSAHTVSLLHFLQNAGSFGSNLAHHLQASGYSGRLLILGIVLMGVASLSHSARRRGRAEEAMREQVERVNPTGAHYTARERRRAAKAAGLR